MQNGIHFISGMPRSGSTLLAALLRQNPRFHAGMTSPVSSIFLALQGELSGRNEFHVFITNEHREAMLRGALEGYYRDIHHEKVVFDTSRAWNTKLPVLARLFPEAKVICCVRNMAWVIDSVERLLRLNPMEPSKIFNFEPGGTVYSRCEAMTGPGGMVGYAYNATREAFYGEQADRLILVTYESLARRPAQTMQAIYEFIGEPPFEHDFHHVEYDADEFDSRLGTPNLHRVASKVSYTERPTILPPDLFDRYKGNAFWMEPSLNRQQVRVV
jgi:sulfotransferase